MKCISFVNVVNIISCEKDFTVNLKASIDLRNDSNKNMFILVMSRRERDVVRSLGEYLLECNIT